MGTGAVLGIAPSPEYTFLIYASPVGNYFKVNICHHSMIVKFTFSTHRDHKNIKCKNSNDFMGKWSMLMSRRVQQH